MVRVLGVALVREAVPAPDHHGQRAPLHRGVAERRAKDDTQLQDDAVEIVLHVHARVRDHRGQLLPIVDVLPAHHLAAHVL